MISETCLIGKPASHNISPKGGKHVPTVPTFPMNRVPQVKQALTSISRNDSPQLVGIG